MPAIVIGTEVERPPAEVFACATDLSSERSITLPSLRSRPVDAQNVPVRPQHKADLSAQREPRCYLTKSGEVDQSAASGVKIAHKIIALDATKPPSEAWSRAGSTRKREEFLWWETRRTAASAPTR
jgi:hypothetical protein